MHSVSGHQVCACNYTKQILRNYSSLCNASIGVSLLKKYIVIDEIMGVYEVLVLRFDKYES